MIDKPIEVVGLLALSLYILELLHHLDRSTYKFTVVLHGAVPSLLEVEG